MRRIARERMEILFAEAGERAARGQKELARRYCVLARRISMRYNVPLPDGMRRRFCRRCHMVLTPGVTSSVRLRRGRLNVRCRTCGNLMRFPVKGRAGRRNAVSDARAAGKTPAKAERGSTVEPTPTDDRMDDAPDGRGAEPVLASDEDDEDERGGGRR